MKLKVFNQGIRLIKTYGSMASSITKIQKSCSLLQPLDSITTFITKLQKLNEKEKN